MKTVVDVGLPAPKQPFSWAVTAPAPVGKNASQTSKMLFTAHGPVRADGSINTGGITEQARLTFANLDQAVRAAGGTLDDVTQVLIYMLDVTDMPAIDAVYREFFEAPYPNRSSAAVAGLVVPYMKIEIVAYAMIETKNLI